jgi:hypothetical protein
MHLRYERTHLRTRDLHGVQRHRGGEGLNLGLSKGSRAAADSSGDSNSSDQWQATAIGDSA